MLFTLLASYSCAIARGLRATLLICGSAWFFGLLFGVMLGYFSQRSKVIAKILCAGAFLLLSIPVLVILFWLHYPAQALLHITIKPVVTTIATLTIVNSILTAELVKKALDNVPLQYALAARVCGVQERQIFCRITFPLVFRQILPGLLTLQVTILHMSLFGSLISVEEIFRVAQQINAQIYQPVEIYTLVAILFLVISLPFHLLAAWLKGRYTRDLSER